MSMPMLAGALAGCLALTATQLRADDATAETPRKRVAKGPRLVCPEPTFDFGVREPAEAVEHGFVLRNDGDAVLNISKVKPTCGCTVADWKTKLLQPGQEARLNCRLKLKGYKGPQKKSIRIHSNDPAQPIYRVWFKGNVRVDVELKPSVVNFSQITHTSAVARKVRLTAVGRAVQITDVTCASDLFGIEVNKVAGLAAELLITTKPPLPMGTHRTRIIVHTDDAKYPDLYLPVIVSILSEVRVLPKVLYLPRPPLEERLTRSILVRPSKVSQFNILRVEAPHPDIKATIIPVKRGIQRVELKNIPVTRDLDGKEVRIFTNLSVMKEIKVPFRMAK